ncbi:MAG: hypothetical protein R2713_08935 [Ilumatobacteraceae bacterium]
MSSNFERLLFEMNGRDGGLTAEQLQRFRSTGRLSVEDDQRAEWLDGVFVAERIDDEATIEVIRRTRADRHAARPALGRRRRRRRAAAGRLARSRVRWSRSHRPPGQVPRCRGAGDGRAAAAAAAPRRPVRSAGTDHGAADDLATVQRYVATTFGH